MSDEKNTSGVLLPPSEYTNINNNPNEPLVNNNANGEVPTFNEVHNQNEPNLDNNVENLAGPGSLKSNTKAEYLPPTTYANNNPTVVTDSEVPPLNKNQNDIDLDKGAIENLQCALKTTSQWANCPYCRQSGITQMDKKFSYVSCLSCVFSLGLPWCLVQCCRSKVLNCYDAKHFCGQPDCKKELANYTSC